MEDEEAVLKKQLDEAKDFETRREIRQKLREIRKKRINALDTDVGSSDRRSRRRQARENEADKTQKAAEVLPAVVQNQVDVNTVENGEVDEEKGGEKAVKENKRDEEEQETNGESVPEALNGGTEQNKEGDEEEKEEEQEEEEKEEKKEEEPAEEADEEDEPRPPAKPQRPSDGKITEEYVEQLEDVDDLEELLKEVSLSEFNIRKKIRNVIRERKKQRAIANAPKITRSHIGGSNISRSVQEKRETRNITGGKEESSTRTETEVTSVGGSTVTVTKTSKTTQRTFGKGNIDDMFDKRKKERMMAKRKEAADKKQGRAAFKAKLEAQNPKPAGGGGRHFQSGGKITRAMIEWCRRNTYGYEGVDIQNFTTSWTNGLAMCALIHRFVPDKIDYETLDPKNRRANWKVAFDVAGECGVEPLLELEDIMSCSIPEPKSLMTYVHFIYQFFCEGPKERTPPPGWDEDED